MKPTYKQNVIELYQKKICKFYGITAEQFFTAHDEPGYNRKFYLVRQIFLYLCKIRPIQQKEVLDYFKDNGLYIKQGYATNMVTNLKAKMSIDPDFEHIINRLK